MELSPTMPAPQSNTIAENSASTISSETEAHEPTMTACHKTFAVAELAEAIFLELSMSDLLCAVQATCQHWKAIVDSSTHLQQALFFSPVPIAPLSWRDDEDDEEWQQDAGGEWVWPAGVETRKICEHPLISRTLTDDAFDWDALRRLAIHGASWRKALATQPPTSVLDISYMRRRSTKDYGDREAYAKNPNGVRLNEVFVDLGSPKLLDSISLQGWQQWDIYNHPRELDVLRSVRVKKTLEQVHAKISNGVADQTENDNSSACHSLFNIPELSEMVFLELPMCDLLCAVQQVCREWKAIVDNSPHDWVWPDGKQNRRIYEHPLFSTLFDRDEWRTRDLTEDGLRRLNYPGATWKKSLVTQPPIADLDYQHRIHKAGPNGITMGDVFGDADDLAKSEFDVIAGWGHWIEFEHVGQLQDLKLPKAPRVRRGAS
ncbi:uncharacterized protein LTR77_010226 [Saxophila tyrrhenica]|uniref:F-box domain-containing protein n=1 Tax=Saxophila tyrrhenica TaxID=1690608 RepID=A0AAV9NWT1_9PEZI|nr:hypothetical protein LTR77_010226 [Saxophila tyrrhenica]